MKLAALSNFVLSFQLAGKMPWRCASHAGVICCYQAAADDKLIKTVWV
jgi:hypothetical protein